MRTSYRAGVVPVAAMSVALVLGGLSPAQLEPAGQLVSRAAPSTVQVESMVLTALDAVLTSPFADVVDTAKPSAMRSRKASARKVSRRSADS